MRAPSGELIDSSNEFAPHERWVGVIAMGQVFRHDVTFDSTIACITAVWKSRCTTSSDC